MRSLRRPFLLALVLGAAVCSGAEPETPPPTTPPPVLGPEVPRGAMSRFLAAAREGSYAKAAEYLNLRELTPSERVRKGPELARELETVLDRALWVDPEQLSAEPDGDPDDGLPPLRDSLGTIETDDGPVEMLIERVPQPGGARVWKIAASTVTAIPALYEQFGWGPLASVLPAPFFTLRLLNVRLWQWIGFVVLGALAALVAWAGAALALRLGWRVLLRRGLPPDRLAAYATGPLRLGFGLIAFASGVPLLELAVPVHRVVVGAEKAFAIVAITWLSLRLLDVLAARVEQRHARAWATVSLGRNSVKVFVAIVAGIAALQNFGFNVTGLIAGLGVGGLAVALAAQKTVENLFGSVSLVADQPVRVGDVCRFGDTVGTIEDIGLRSTRVRTVDRTLVTIPNAQFSTLALENLSRRDRIPVRATVTLPQGSAGGRVRQLLSALRTMLAEQPKVHRDSIRVRFMSMGPQALEIEFVAFVMTSSWDEFVEVREQILLQALDVVAESGAAIR